MSGLNFHIRGIPKEIMSLLRSKASEENTSINSLILQLIESGVGYSQMVERPIYCDLDHLAGTWSEEQEKQFTEETAIFEAIDEAIWS